MLNWVIKGIFFSVIGVGAVGFTDIAMDLHNETAAAYQKGSISASAFTKMLTSGDRGSRKKCDLKR